MELPSPQSLRLRDAIAPAHRRAEAVAAMLGQIRSSPVGVSGDASPNRRHEPGQSPGQGDEGDDSGDGAKILSSTVGSTIRRQAAPVPPRRDQLTIDVEPRRNATAI